MTTLRWMLIVGVACLLLACSSAEESRAAFLQRADQYFEAGQFEKSRVEYLNALKLDANDVEARYGAGRSFERLASFPQAVGHYVAATDTDPAHLQSRLALARIYILMRSADRAAAQVDALLQHHPENNDALALRASVLALRGQHSESRALAQQIVNREPDNTFAVPLLTSELMGADDSEGALRVIRQALVLKPEDVGFHGVYAQVLWELGDETGYLKEMKLLTELEPDEVGHTLNYVRALSMTGREDQATSLLQRMAEQPQAALPVQLRYLQQMQQQEAASEQLLAAYDRLEKFSAEPMGLRLAKASLLQNISRTAQAREVYASIISDGSRKYEPRAQVALAALDFAEEQADAARERLRLLLDEQPGNLEALRLLAEIDVNEGRLTDAINNLRLVLRDDPNRTETHSRLAAVYLQNGQPELAKDILAAAVNALPDEESLRTQLTQVAAQVGDWDTVEAQADAALLREPLAPGALDAKVRALLATAKGDAAMEYARQLEAARPQNSIGPFYVALAALELGDRKMAEQALKRSLERQPGAIEPLSTLVRMQVQDKRHPAALRILEEQMEQMGQGAGAHLQKIKGDVLMSQDRVDEAMLAYRKALQQEPTLVPASRALAQALFADRQRDAALATLRQGLRVSNHRNLYLDLGLALQSAGNSKGAIDIYRKALIEHPSDLTFANNLAMLLTEYDATPANLAEADRLTQGFEGRNDAAYLDTLGWVKFKQGNYPDAIRALRKATELAPGSSLVRYHLAKALLGGGDGERALDHLLAATESEQSFAGRDDALRLVAQLSQEGFQG